MTELELFDKLNPKRDLPQATCDVISQVYKVMQEENEILNRRVKHLNNTCKELAHQANKLQKENADLEDTINKLREQLALRYSLEDNPLPVQVAFLTVRLFLLLLSTVALS